MSRRDDIVGSRFRIESTLQEGALSTTYQALDMGSKQRIVLRAFEVDDVSGESIERIGREAAALRALKHSAIPRFIDAFKESHGDKTYQYLAQEHVTGDRLDDLIATGDRFDDEQTRYFLSQMLDTLAYLHQLSPPVVHRNIKPSTIFRTSSGEFKLIGFASLEAAISDEKMDSTIVGTTGYMAPEQLTGEATPASDLYGLAASAVHLASGVHPTQLPTRQLKLDFQDQVDLSNSVVAALEAMLEPDLEDRISDAVAARELTPAPLGEQWTLSEAGADDNTDARPVSELDADGLFSRRDKLIADPPPVMKSTFHFEHPRLEVTIPPAHPPLGEAERKKLTAYMIGVGITTFFFLFPCGLLFFPFWILAAGGCYLMWKWGHRLYTAQDSTSEQLIVATDGVHFVTRRENIDEQREEIVDSTYIPLENIEDVELRLITSPDLQQLSEASFPKAGVVFIDNDGTHHTFGTSLLTIDDVVESDGSHRSELKWLSELVILHWRGLASEVDAEEFQFDKKEYIEAEIPNSTITR